MTATNKDATDQDRYHVASVQKTETPEGMEGDNWHCYVIKRGTAVLTGKKPGSLKDVTEHAEEFAAKLNARNGSFGGSYYSARKKT